MSGKLMNRNGTWAVWAIAALCIGFYVAEHMMHWHALETAQAAWRNMGRPAVFRSRIFWFFAPISTLLHTGPLHIVVNLWCLAVLGVFLERRQGSITVLLLWLVGSYIAMGFEALVGGVGRIGLSAVTYTLLGVAVSHWRYTILSPCRLYTGAAMLALLLAGELEAIGVRPLIPEIAHTAHAVGLIAGLLIARALPWQSLLEEK
jgi:membrane associated rhomboid family serine protease